MTGLACEYVIILSIESNSAEYTVLTSIVTHPRFAVGRMRMLRNQGSFLILFDTSG